MSFLVGMAMPPAAEREDEGHGGKVSYRRISTQC